MSKLFVKDKRFYKMALVLALPIVLQNMITIGVNIMDTIMLGSYGEIQLSGSSLANEYINIFHILCMGMGSGAAVLTAQFYGRGDSKSIKHTVTIMMRLSLSVAALFTVFSVVAPSFIMSIFTDDAAVIEKGSIYFLWSAPNYILMGISLTLTLILRSVRRVMVPLVTSIICFFVNIFFNWVFIFGNLGAPEMQIAGAALGTVIARVVEALIIGVYVFKVEKNVGMRIKDLFGSCGGLLPTYIKYSVPVFISDAMLAFGNSMMSVIIGHISTEYVAANAIVATVLRLSTVFTQGLGQASGIMTGNSLGRGERDTAYREGVTFTSLSAVVGFVAGGIILALCPFIIGLYNIEDATRDIAFQLMYSVAIMVVFQSMQSVLTKGVLRGGGDTKFLMFADVAFLWLASIPLGALCGLVFGLSPFIVSTVLKIDWAIKTFICLYRLKTKKWIKIV